MGIGTLVSVGMGSFTGLSTSDYALGALPLPQFARPDAAGFGWSIALALAVAVGAFVVRRAARGIEPVVSRRRLLTLPAAGIVIAGLAIAYDQISGKSFQEVLFSGQDQLPSTVVGVDPSEGMIEAGKGLTPAELHATGAEAIPLPDGSIDLAFSTIAS